MYAFTIIQLVYTTISLAAYVLMLFIVLSIRTKLKTFSTLLVTSSIINVLGCLNILVQNRLNRDPTFFGYYEWLKAGIEGLPLYLRVFHFTWYSTGWELQYASTFLTTFNRFTAIVMYERHENVWKYSPIIIFLALGSVIAPEIVSLNSNGTYSFRPSHNDYDLDFSASASSGGLTMFQKMTIYSVLYITLSTIMIILSVRKVQAIKTRSSTVGRLERNLYVISLVNFGAMWLNFASFGILLLWVLVFPQVQTLQDFLDIFYPICSDIFCLSLPYYTILLPGPVNSEIMRRLRGGRYTPTATSAVRPTTTNAA